MKILNFSYLKYFWLRLKSFLIIGLKKKSVSRIMSINQSFIKDIYLAFIFDNTFCLNYLILLFDYLVRRSKSVVNTQIFFFL